jgi:hypothetical protein
MRTVDNDIQLIAIDLYVIAHIAQFHDDIRVSFRIEVTCIKRTHEIQIVKGTFVASHIAFVYHIHTSYLGVGGRIVIIYYFIFRRYNELNLPAGINEQGGQEYRQD